MFFCLVFVRNRTTDLRCSTTEPQRLCHVCEQEHFEVHLLHASFQHTARISSVDGVMFGFHERELSKTIKFQSPREELNVTLSNSALRCSITEPQRLFRNLAAIPGLLNSTSPAYCHDQWAQWKSISELGI